MNRLSGLLLGFLLVFRLGAQTDSLRSDDVFRQIAASDTVAADIAPEEAETRKKDNPYRLRPAAVAVPAAMVAVGAAGVRSPWLKARNRAVRRGFQKSVHGKCTADDYLQYTPILAAYGLRAFGVRGRHDWVDKTIILGMSTVLMAAAVNAVKAGVDEPRPDGRAFNSFPSGHSATAFMGAHFLAREYWQVSPWIGVAGYAVAAGTGVMRLYNDRHWATDVLAGAGIGILSVEAACLLYPWVMKAFCKRRARYNVYLAPYVAHRSRGLGVAMAF